MKEKGWEILYLISYENDETSDLHTEREKKE